MRNGATASAAQSWGVLHQAGASFSCCCTHPRCLSPALIAPDAQCWLLSVHLCVSQACCLPAKEVGKLLLLAAAQSDPRHSCAALSARHISARGCSDLITPPELPANHPSASLVSGSRVYVGLGKILNVESEENRNLFSKASRSQ